MASRGSANNDLNLSMFRAYDIRTPGSSLTPELSARLARAEAHYFTDTLNVPGVVLAHDARLSGPSHLIIASETYRKAGLDVLWIPGATSTSHFYFTAMQHPEYAAVLCGASHNPAGDTGRKTLAPGVRPVAEHIGPAGGLDEIKRLYQEDPPLKRASAGSFRAVHNLSDYVDYSCTLAGVSPYSLEGVPVLHDYLFGAGGREMALAYAYAGALLEPLHFPPDGQFPLGDPNPVKENVVREGLDALKRGNYLLAAFFDGDADRIDFYAGDGGYLSSSFVYAAILPHIRRRFPDAGLGVFADLKSNPLAVIEMARSGFKVQVIRNGHSQIKEAMYQDPTMVGTVEESAHYYEAFKLSGGGPYCTENTLYLGLLATRAWHEDPQRFEELFEIQGSSAREREWGHHFPDDARRGAALDAVQEHFEREGAEVLTRTRGGLDLDATMLRRGLPFDIDEDTQLAPDWIQVCQRVSQSENGLARWEVCAGTVALARQARHQIERLVKQFGAGSAYQG